ncbi:MAG: MoaD/ThiS family protein [Candidatus Neomarinimicrobiota bacterium]
MKITVKCFSHIKYALGKNKIIINLDSGATTQDLEQEIRRLAEGKLDGINFVTALNQHYIKIPVELQEGDEVAFIPPVQGG